jgi:acid phosphatase (class A)
LIRTVSFIAALAALSACASADTAAPGLAPPPGPLAAKATGYLAASALDGKAILPGPPTAGSAYDKADRGYYDESRSLAGSPRWQAAIRDNEIWAGGALRAYSCAIGAEISEQATPVTWKLMHRVELDVRTVGTPPKNFYNRTRPAIDNDKPICIAREPWMRTNASYPSGHAMVGWAWGLILAEIAPAKANEALIAGREMGESRAVCGVHYPSDVEAGRTLSAAMVARLHAEPAFLADMAAARAELARAPKPTCDG